MSHWKPILATLAVVVAAAVVYLGREQASGFLVAATDRVETMGALAPLAFVALYSVALLILLPATPLLLAAGILFGLTLGTVYGFVANTVAGLLAFLCGRHVARSAIERRLGRDDRMEALDRALRGGGLRAAFLIRLSPVLPSSLINYGLGLTSIRLRHYLTASLATIPFVFLYVYYGVAIGELTLLGSGRGPERGAGYYALLVVGGLATLAVTILLTRRARRILDRHDGP